MLKLKISIFIFYLGLTSLPNPTSQPLYTKRIKILMKASTKKEPKVCMYIYIYIEYVIQSILNWCHIIILAISTIYFNKYLTPEISP